MYDNPITPYQLLIAHLHNLDGVVLHAQQLLVVLPFGVFVQVVADVGVLEGVFDHLETVLR
jgi:hypothetical protein